MRCRRARMGFTSSSWNLFSLLQYMFWERIWTITMQKSLQKNLIRSLSPLNLKLCNVWHVCLHFASMLKENVYNIIYIILYIHLLIIYIIYNTSIILLNPFGLFPRYKGFWKTIRHILKTETFLTTKEVIILSKFTTETY